MKQFRSAISWGLFVPLFVFFTILAVFMVFQKAWGGFVVILLVVSFFIHLIITTVYTINKQMLLIKCSVLVRQQIAISSITHIKQTNSPWSSPALSLNRLEVRYLHSKVLISPANQKQFCQQMLMVNPAIVINIAGMLNKA